MMNRNVRKKLNGCCVLRNIDDEGRTVPASPVGRAL